MPEKKQHLQHNEDGYHGDEISLVDLWLVLARRKWLVIGIAVLCLAAGLAYAVMREPVYSYTTVIELARTGDGKPVESTDSARARMTQVIIPLVRHEMVLAQTDPGSRPPRASVRVPQGGGRLLEIVSEYPRAARDDIGRFHERLSHLLKAEHDRLVSMEQERLTLAQETIQGEIKRIEAEQQRIRARITEAGSRLSAGRILQGEATGEATDEARAMTLLIIQSQIEDAHEKILALEQTLYQELPSRSDELRLQLAETNNQLERISFTKAHATALVSEYPVGAGKPLIAALALVLGVMLGVFGAFWAEFLAQAKTVAHQRKNRNR